MKNRKTLITILLAAIILIGIFAVTRIAGGKKSADVETPQEITTQETTKNEENNLDAEAENTPQPENTPVPETQSQEPAPTEAPTEAPIEPPEDAEVLEVQEEVEIIVPEDQESEGF